MTEKKKSVVCQNGLHDICTSKLALDRCFCDCHDTDRLKRDILEQMEEHDEMDLENKQKKRREKPLDELIKEAREQGVELKTKEEREKQQAERLKKEIEAAGLNPDEIEEEREQ